MESFDQGMWNWFQARRTPWLDSAVMAVSLLGTPGVLGLVVLLTVAALVWKRKLTSAAVVAWTFVMSFFLVAVVQKVVGRERPEVGYRPLVRPVEAFSFPSEHAWLATATYLAVSLAVADLLPEGRVRALPIAAAILLALAIGVGRLFVGLCYPTDVAAGWLAGFCLATLLRGIAKLGRTREKAS